jgi:chromosome segregation ATPase
VIKKVEPKRKKYAEVKAILDQAMGELNEKTTQLNIVKDAVAKLEADCKSMQDEKQRLEAEMTKCNGRMYRAEKLVVLLADEGVRWKETVGTL